jgi:hypothetical protein
LQAEAELAESSTLVGELKRRVKEQAHELAAYKVDTENKAGKVGQKREQLLAGLDTENKIAMLHVAAAG